MSFAIYRSLQDNTVESVITYTQQKNFVIDLSADISRTNIVNYTLYIRNYNGSSYVPFEPNGNIKVMLLEGDYTDKPIPQKYFEGLKNSYEDGYIPNNLFTSDMQIGNISGSGILDNDNAGRIRTTSFIKVEPSTIYTIDYDSTFIPTVNTIYFYDESKTFISYYDQSLVFTTPNNAYYIHFKHQGSSLNNTCNYRLLKGDYSSNPLIYEEVMEHSGQYRCKVEVQGKNLCDNIFEFGNIDLATGNCNSSTSTIRSVNYIPIKPNTTYILSSNGSVNYGGRLTLRFYDNDLNYLPFGSDSGVIVQKTENNKGYAICNSLNNAYFCKIRVSDTSSLLTDIQLEEGNTATAYEPYYNQTQTVYLNSPLLKGDEVVYKEGKLCHYHKMGKVVLDGSDDEGWAMTSNDAYNYTSKSTMAFQTSRIPRKYSNESIILRSDKFICEGKPMIASELLINDKEILRPFSSTSTSLGVCISKSKLSTLDINGFKQWLSENPTTVVYELANPYYETISTSELCLPITTNCKLLTSSNIPLTTMSTRVFTEEVNILANTQYSLNFNSDVASTVNITLGGTVLSNQAIVKGYNKFSITTPSTLVDNLLIIEGSGVNISEVVVTEYDEGVCEYIEGLKSSFEDGYIPPKNLLNDYEVIKSSNSTHQYSRVAVKPNTIYTLFYPSLITEGCNNVYGVYNTEGTSALLTFSVSESSRTFNTGNREAVNVYGRLKRSNGNLVIYTDPESLDDNWNKGLALFEGDWTHLHLTEEDLNHLGQYKVEYKVVGKNKATLQEEGAFYNYTSGYKMSSTTHNSYIALVEPSKTYIVSFENIDRVKISNLCFWDSSMKFINGLAFNKNDLTFTTPYNAKFIAIAVYKSATAFQLEEGTVATEYEPYKESIQTVYLNSPLLEGDTIEEIDGEVYHVHRYGKVVLDGSKDEVWSHLPSYLTETSAVYNTTSISGYASGNGNTSSTIEFQCDRFVPHIRTYSENISWGSVLMNEQKGFRIRLPLTETSGVASQSAIRKWLSENPTTVVYGLANPTYELIPSSSIVCKSYPNGHLDFNTNVHIDNTVNFVKANLPITYANTSTNYKLQFVSNKDMENVTINVLGNIMENVTINKGLNKISFTSPSDATNILTFEGIGRAYISNVQLVATEKDIDYFKGLYSTYECGLIEDESNENYGKYEVNIVSHNAPIQFGKGGKIE